MQKQTQKRLKSGFKIISWTVSTLEGGGSIMLPALYTPSSLRFWLARNARAYASASSIGFCFISVCISSSSSSISPYHSVHIYGPNIRALQITNFWELALAKENERAALIKRNNGLHQCFWFISLVGYIALGYFNVVPFFYRSTNKFLVALGTE